MDEKEKLELCSWFLDKILPEPVDLGPIDPDSIEAGQQQGWNECIVEMVELAAKLDVAVPAQSKLDESFWKLMGMEPIRVGKKVTEDKNEA